MKAYGIQRLVDIRTVPRSRRNPQFEGAALADSLGAEGIEYVHLQALGGLRQPCKDSPNTGWRNQSFRGYADYMLTQAFEDELKTLISLSREKRVAIMCAEAVPWRCHRSLVSDALIARGIPGGRDFIRAQLSPAQAHILRPREGYADQPIRPIRRSFFR